LCWISLGVAVGSVLSTLLRRGQSWYTGRAGSIPYWVVRKQAKAVRSAIRLPASLKWLRDMVDEDLSHLSEVLEKRLGLPPLPSVSFDDPAISETDEYLRRVLPNLKAKHVEAAKDIADDFMKKPASAAAASSVPRSPRLRSAKR